MTIVELVSRPAATKSRTWLELLAEVGDSRETAFVAEVRAALRNPILLESLYDALINHRDAQVSGLKAHLQQWLDASFKPETFDDMALDLLRNMRRLVASAIAASYWMAEKEEDLKGGFMESAQTTLQEFRTANGLVLHPADYVHDIDEITRGFPEVALWVKWWLKEAHSSSASRSTVEAPFACVKDGRGVIATIRLQRCSGNRSLLFQHPSCALYPVQRDWTKPLETLSRVCNFPVCWEIKCESLPLKDRAFSGPSAGGAAARAFWHLDPDPIRAPDPGVPDPGVLVLAEIDASRLAAEAPWGTLRFKAVGKVEAKKDAAHAAKTIDTLIEIKDGKWVVWDWSEAGWKERPLASVDARQAAAS